MIRGSRGLDSENRKREESRFSCFEGAGQQSTVSKNLREVVMLSLQQSKFELVDHTRRRGWPV